MLGDDEKRRRVIDAIVPMLPDRRMCLAQLVRSKTPLVIKKDVSWMIERIQYEGREDVQSVWAELVRRVFDWHDPDQSDAILTASPKSPVLAKEFAQPHEPVELNSPEAQKMKAHYLEIQEFTNRANNHPVLDPPPAKRIAFHLVECESGNLSAWWRLNREMTLEPDSALYGDELESDLTVLPGWKAADAATKARIIATAKRYVLEQDPKTREWLGKNIIYRPAFAGYRALRLLLQETPDFIFTLPTEVWKRWAPIILAYLTSSGIGDENPHRELVKIAYEHAPDDIIRALLVMVDKQNKELSHIFIAREVEYCWDDRLADALLKKANDEKLKPECMGSLLGDLLNHNVDEAKVFAESLVPLPPPSSEDARNRAIAAARALMIHANDAGWSVVGPAIREDTEFGREVISAVAHNAESIWKRLTEEQLADLYLWLVRECPPAEEETKEGLTDYRDSIPCHLKERGTHPACEAIQQIFHELPELDWLKWTLREAQNNTRRCTWTPPQPTDILKLAGDPQRRLIRDGDDLLDVLIESLNRLVVKLQGETPAAPFLWNVWKKDKKKMYRPKDENAFSDYVTIHLREDLEGRGVIVNREVEIRNGEGSGKGERTDIHVDVSVQSSRGKVRDRVSVIIEVKGCWHKERNTAMETQLVDRYLRDNRCQYGMYLVGWFNCDQWDGEDDRRKKCPKYSTDKARTKFNAQADELSQQGMRIKAFVMNTALSLIDSYER